MWLLTREPQSAGLVLSHDQGAPPVVRFHQPFGSWACSSQHPPPRPPTLIQSTAAHFTLSTNQRLYSILHTTTVSTGTALGLHPFPQKKAGKIYIYPFQPATKQLHIANICIMWQILSAIRLPSPSVWLPCVISILSKSPKIVSCIYPALCSFDAYSSFQRCLTVFAQQLSISEQVQSCTNLQIRVVVKELWR